VCVVWHDGAVWRAAVDSSQLYELPPNGETPALPPGRLACSPALTDFFAERQYGTLSPADSCNYAVNIYDDGAILSLVTDSSPHGATCFLDVTLASYC
jgi:tripeptidyl-peptidase-2